MTYDYNNFADSLPFGATEQPDFTPLDLEQSLATQQRANSGAGYDNYFSTDTINFRPTDDPIEPFLEALGPLREHVVAVPRSDWNTWNIVNNGTDVYAEPSTTTVLEKGAIAVSADSLIARISEELNSDNVGKLSQEEVAERLRMLGHLPFWLSGARGMEANNLRLYNLANSVLEARPEGPYLVVHTPVSQFARGSKPGKDGFYHDYGVRDYEPTSKTYTDRRKLLAAQSAGLIVSTRFSADGSYDGDGQTQEFRYGAAGIPRAQVKYLRRRLAEANTIMPGMNELPAAQRRLALGRRTSSSDR